MSRFSLVMRDGNRLATSLRTISEALDDLGVLMEGEDFDPKKCRAVLRETSDLLRGMADEVSNSMFIHAEGQQ